MEIKKLQKVKEALEYLVARYDVHAFYETETAKEAITELNEFLEKENVAPAALEKLLYYGSFDGAHHKMWAIDQTVRILAGNSYDDLIAKYCDGGEYEWDIGIAP